MKRVGVCFKGGCLQSPSPKISVSLSPAHRKAETLSFLGVDDFTTPDNVSAVDILHASLLLRNKICHVSNVLVPTELSAGVLHYCNKNARSAGQRAVFLRSSLPTERYTLTYDKILFRIANIQPKSPNPTFR